MNKRILWAFGTFLLTFLLVYLMITGGFRMYSRSAKTAVITDTALQREFGIPQSWQEKYGITVKNDIDLAIDHDNDGLTVWEEYHYNTDPHDPDTDNDGYDDGREVENGYVPNGDGVIDANKNTIPDKWEMEMIGQLVDGEDDHDDDAMTNAEEFIFGTDPKDPDTDKDGYDDGQEVTNGYDPLAPGDIRLQFTIEIDAIDVRAPIILSHSADEISLQNDLEKGVIHYPGTPMPGQRGNVYIAGHSSNYIWSKGTFNTVFSKLNDLVVGDIVTITLTTYDGRIIEYIYETSLVEEVQADDQRIFAESGSNELTLTTCWPLGSNARRIMVKALLRDV
jgi:LPXTG-site transpeptidase (sortase) family protein